MTQFLYVATVVSACTLAFEQPAVQGLVWLRGDRRPLKHRQPPDFRELMSRFMGYFCFMLWMRSSLLRIPAMWLPAPVRLLGLLSVLLGLCIVLCAHRQLGRHWVNGVGVRGDHELIKSGPYARVRHPMYIGFCLGYLGVMLLGACWIVACFSVFASVALLFRVKDEERLLLAHFRGGEKVPPACCAEYRSYLERVPSLVPFSRVPRRYPFR